MTEKIFIDLFVEHWKTTIILLYIGFRLFPEMRKYLPDIILVLLRKKKISDIVFKSTFDLRYFTRKHIFIADEDLPVTDCKSFKAQLMYQIDQLRHRPEPVVFNMTKVQRASESAFLGFRDFIKALVPKDNFSIQFILPRRTDATGSVLKMTEFAIEKTKDCDMIEAWEDKRRSNGNDDL